MIRGIKQIYRRVFKTIKNQKSGSDRDFLGFKRSPNAKGI